ncbi:MAG TPA: GNAT family N-acetyltransferase [Anaerolineae bacterium]|nr:GNAT family N-acetyltransferase [Anaerolineae bacterium]
MIISRHTWAFERGTLWAVELDRQTPAPVPPRVAAVFREAHRESAELLAAAMGLPHSEPVVRRFTTGRRCFAAWVSDRIAAYGWVSQAAECIGELEREIQLLPGEAYIWDCVTLPSYRRQRLYSALLSHIVARLRSESVQRVWIGSSLDNRASIRGFANAGFRPVVTLVYARLFELCGLGAIRHRTAPHQLVNAARRVLITDREHWWGPVAVGRSEPAHHLKCVQIEG